MSRASLREQRLNTLRVATIIIATALAASVSLALKVSTQAQPKDGPQPIYSADTNDAWNRIFYHLFTRTVKHRMTKEFQQAAPFFKIDTAGFPSNRLVSTRLFERVEIGDRAIDPLYPSFMTFTGLRAALREPRLSLLKQALMDALGENRTRPAIHRALMQADVWAAYDMIARTRRVKTGPDRELNERGSEVLPLLARFIKKLALTQSEIKSLPDNYALAAIEHNLPPVFSEDGEWMEVEWTPDRLHDHEADFRRVARIFVKPNVPIRDKQRFLESLKESHGEAKELGAVAITIQNLLIDSEGNLAPTHLTCEVQTRSFSRDEHGEILRTEMHQYELSRRLLLAEPQRGGFISLAETAPMYIPMAGNDYSFATPQWDDRGEAMPVLATLRARCSACHGHPNAMAIFTFNAHPPDPAPPVTLLRQPNDKHARYVVGLKLKQDNFKTLSAEWGRR